METVSKGSSWMVVAIGRPTPPHRQLLVLLVLVHGWWRSQSGPASQRGTDTTALDTGTNEHLVGVSSLPSSRVNSVSLSLSSESIDRRRPQSQWRKCS